MKWQVIQSNWFSAALILLLLIILFQKKGFWDTTAATATGSITPSPKNTLKESPSALGLGMESTRAAVPTEVDQDKAEAFLKRFAKVAVSERKVFGIPASVLLATAFLNSHAGSNELAVEAHNFFLVPCTEDWEGETSDDEHNCVRKYETAWAGWRDFSIYLSGRAWFGDLKQSAGKDWRKWAAGVQGQDVSRVKQFNKKLLEVIEYYRLYELDKQ